jgi:hypothetical protein
MKSMTRIFVGLVKCGAWGCFDEFNRLEEATLSAISMQIQAIQSALKTKQSSVVLMGEMVNNIFFDQNWNYCEKFRCPWIATLEFSLP